MENHQTHTHDCLNTARTNQCSQRSLSNAQYFVRELVQRHAFPLQEVAQNSGITKNTLKNLYELKTRSLSMKKFRCLVQFYCAVIHARVKPIWYQKTNSPM